MRLLAARTGERPPSDADLEAFYADHRNEYRPPDRVTFWQVFLASSAHGSSTLSDAEADGRPSLSSRAGASGAAPR